MGKTAKRLNNSEMTKDPNSQFVRLLTQHHSAIYAYIYSLHAISSDADDIMQETSASLWKRFPEYDADKGPFLPWAYRFAFYEVLKFRKTRSRNRLVFDNDLLEQISETVHQESESLNQRSALLKNCVARLPEKDRQLLSCRYEKQSSIARFSEQLKIPVKRLYRELERIRLVLFQCVDRQVNQGGNTL